ncbi:hypothetical protein [Methylotenera sp.]|uniref:DUF6988 family protein n=1 Tax=Methylotenera sp. TaxID=2051956 RepID=UPI002489BB83|nr:hypothetical protein [Methylotenera sp.]MDI1361020.1 hypothetical protein [Methylotenera sp.]
MNEKDFLQFIERTSAFQAEIAKIISRLNPASEGRLFVAFQSGLLAFEHATAALQLISSRLLPSGYSLFRPQFESLVRGIWLLHAASDKWIDTLSQPLTLEAANKSNQGPTLAEMLVQLGKSEAPAHIVEQLQEFKDITWKALNSYTHGGLHPISRTMTGYPFQLTYHAMRNSNAVTALTVQLLAILAGKPENMAAIRRLHNEFVDCLPIINI